MSRRSRIVLGVLANIGLVLWLSLLTPTTSEPAIADGVTIKGYESARDSISEQIRANDPHSPFNRDDEWDATTFTVELTSEEIMGILMYENSMQARINLAREPNSYLYWNAFFAITFLIAVSLLFIGQPQFFTYK